MFVVLCSLDALLREGAVPEFDSIQSVARSNVIGTMTLSDDKHRSGLASEKTGFGSDHDRQAC